MEGRDIRGSTLVSAGIAAALSLAAFAASASGATVIGSTGVPNDGLGYLDNSLRVQDVDPGEGGELYRVPAAGVITSWSSRANPIPNRTQKLIITRNPDLDNDWDIVAKDELRTLATPDALNTFLVRIPVAAGDQLAIYTPDGQPGNRTSAVWNSAGGGTVGNVSGAEPSGSFSVSSFTTNTRLNLSASIEPDADGDGFGDETQDRCPSSATAQGSCPAKKPKKCKKAKKKRKAAGKKKRCKKRKKK